MSIALGKFFGVDEAYWISLQVQYNLGITKLEKGVLIVIPNYTKTEGLELLNSILDKNYYAQKFLSLTTLSDQIIKRFIETQKYFTVDILNSPVIEFSLGYKEEKLKRRERVYYTKNKAGKTLKIENLE